MQTEAYVVMPEGQTAGQIGVDSSHGSGKYKCLYLLHGLTDDHTIWMRRTSIERYATKYGIAVVMPCGHRSFYSNLKDGMNYYNFIAHELPRIICEFFNVSDRREDNFIGGLSMGGYGALKAALRDPQRFSAAIGLSSATEFNDGWRLEIAQDLFGNDRFPDEDDLYFLADKCVNDPNRPRIYMAVGDRDFLLEENRRFRDNLKGLGYDLEYVEGPGTHNWDFWDEHIQGALKWLLG